MLELCQEIIEMILNVAWEYTKFSLVFLSHITVKYSNIS